MKTYKTGIVAKLKKDLDLDIQGIEDLIESLPEEKKAKIQRRIDNILSTINTI